MKPKKKKDKLKLKPTLKEKRHYLIIELSSKEKLSDNEIKNKIESSIMHFIGSLGLASAGPLFVKIESRDKCKGLSCNSSTSSRLSDSLMKTSEKDTEDKQHTSNTYLYRYLITLSVLTKYVDYVKASLTLFKDKDISMKCVGVSGTIKKSKRFLK